MEGERKRVVSFEDMEVFQRASQHTFAGLENAPLPRVLLHTHSFGARLKPR